MYISRNLEQWNAFLATLQTAFEQGKAQDLLTLLLTPDERDAVGLRLQIVAQLLDKKSLTTRDSTKSQYQCGNHYPLPIFFSTKMGEKDVKVR